MQGSYQDLKDSGILVASIVVRRTETVLHVRSEGHVDVRVNPTNAVRKVGLHSRIDVVVSLLTEV